MHDFVPQVLGLDALLHHDVVTLDGETLIIVQVVDGGIHEFVIHAHRHVGAGHLAFGHLGVDESLAVWMLDADGEHQCPAATVLGNLARGVAVSLHERHNTRTGKRGIVDRCSFGTDVGEVMAHTTPSFHQLHLLLINAHNGSIGVRVTFESDDEAIGERSHLMVVTDARHGTSGRNNIFEVVKHVKHLLCGYGVGVLVFYSCDFIGDSPMHVRRRLLIDLAETIFHGVFVHPDARSQFVAFKIDHGSIECLFVGVGFQLVHEIMSLTECKNTNIC